MFVSFVCWLLDNKKLSVSNKRLLINQLLKSIGTFPTHAIITTNGDKISIRGIPLDGERQVALQHSAEQALSNPALKAVHEEVLYKAVSHGIHNAQDFEQVIFAKAAIWFGQQERDLLAQLSKGNLANSSLNGE